MGKTRYLLEKNRDTKGTPNAKKGTIKGRKGMDLTEENYIKQRWQACTEEIYIKKKKKIVMIQITTMV